jgi:hypothetical protein
MEKDTVVHRNAMKTPSATERLQLYISFAEKKIIPSYTEDKS